MASPRFTLCFGRKRNAAGIAHGIMCCIFDYGIAVFDRRQVNRCGTTKIPISGARCHYQGQKKGACPYSCNPFATGFSSPRDSSFLFGTVFPLLFGRFFVCAGSMAIGGVPSPPDTKWSQTVTRGITVLQRSRVLQLVRFGMIAQIQDHRSEQDIRFQSCVPHIWCLILSSPILPMGS